jgi:hypothetical protein
MSQVVVNLSDPISTWVNKTNEIAADVGNLNALADSAATLVAAINSIDSDVGNRSSLTDAAPDLVTAINNLNTKFFELTDSADIKALFASSTTISLDSNHGAAGTHAKFNLVDSSITSAKLAASSITSDKYADSSIETGHFIAGAITNYSLADSSITFEKIQSAAIKSTNFASVSKLELKNTAGTTLKTLFGPGV